MNLTPVKGGSAATVTGDPAANVTAPIAGLNASWLPVGQVRWRRCQSPNQAGGTSPGA